MEIRALNPDVIVFLTCPYYHGDQLKVTPIECFKPNELVRLEHPILPYHTYRTYHQGYSLRGKEKEQKTFIPIQSVLVDLINENSQEAKGRR
jgi:hypothetical protein